MLEKKGIVFAAIFNETPKQLNTWKEVKNWKSFEGFLWLHLDMTDEASQEWLQQESGLGEFSTTLLLSNDTRPRIVTLKQSLIITLRGINFNPGSDPEDMVVLHMFVSENKIITLRDQKIKAIEEIILDIDNGCSFGNTSEFLIDLTSRMVGKMGDIISETEEHVDLLEGRVIDETNRSLRIDISDVRRKVIMLRRYLLPQRDVFSHLLIEKVSWINDVERNHLRATAEITAKYIDDLDSIRDRAALVQEELSNILSDHMNKMMYQLSIVATIFLPLSLLTGLLGINVAGIPGSNNEIAFWIVCGILVILSIAEYWFFRSKRK